jgi:hypothetical protein
MRLGSVALALTTLLSSCALLHRALPRPPEDPSIQFPSFHEHAATRVGAPGQTSELDGITLRALSIAANDFLPTAQENGPCWQRQEAHRYRVIRREDILFVQIFLDPSACSDTLLDGSVKYAIRTDGRILRRLFDGEPETPLTDAGTADAASSAGTPVPASAVGSTSAAPDSHLPASWFSDGGSSGMDGGVPATDAG